MHLRCCFALVFVTLFVGAGVTGGPIPKNIYVHQGDPAYFQVQMQIAMKYAHFGGNEAAPDAVPLYMSVSQDNRKIEAKNTPYTGSGRLRFCGDLSTGLACFSLTNVGLSDNKKIFRIHYKENNDNSAKYQDFMIFLLEDPPTTLPPSTKITVTTTTDQPQTTKPPTSTKIPTNTATDNGSLWKIIYLPIIAAVVAVGVIVLLAVIIKKRREARRIDNEVGVAGNANGTDHEDPHIEADKIDEQEQEVDDDTNKNVPDNNEGEAGIELQRLREEQANRLHPKDLCIGAEDIPGREQEVDDDTNWNVLGRSLVRQAIDPDLT